ncbi:unnamed protein product [Prorocentrum cordatum]|uniref:Uncharacterized protein n=1 Tax=Prorocentrum cordatum TaxID=2364126 RepID=A0ABN9RHN0_9DINO|nr:unnamed protein product [Polarella glacialis]
MAVESPSLPHSSAPAAAAPEPTSDEQIAAATASVRKTVGRVGSLDVRLEVSQFVDPVALETRRSPCRCPGTSSGSCVPPWRGLRGRAPLPPLTLARALHWAPSPWVFCGLCGDTMQPEAAPRASALGRGQFAAPARGEVLRGSAGPAERVRAAWAWARGRGCCPSRGAAEHGV